MVPLVVGRERSEGHGRRAAGRRPGEVGRAQPQAGSGEGGRGQTRAGSGERCRGQARAGTATSRHGWARGRGHDHGLAQGVARVARAPRVGSRRRRRRRRVIREEDRGPSPVLGAARQRALPCREPHPVVRQGDAGCCRWQWARAREGPRRGKTCFLASNHGQERLRCRSQWERRERPPRELRYRVHLLLSSFPASHRRCSLFMAFLLLLRD
ncbi:hypothetical protein D1007_19170 [Hordeum vulgare]|nr:hypothetical protein D1007_19170 [Hordeum vulgare]